ncbi:MAG: phosphoribosylformylglycinamidine synthase subunit PurS [Candidatus Bathyarchaeota archaeon]|jgi:phosphoribosylformylglycinamidine synthase PurS subunit
MNYKLRIEVSLKRGHVDPEGETTKRLLKELGYSVDKVNIIKVYLLTLESKSRKESEKKAEEICKRLLVNPTKDDYSINIIE